MKLFQTLNKNLLIASLIAATGIPASLASAQFKVEHSAKAEKAPEAKSTETRVMVFTSHDDEHEYEVKIVNGEIELAKIDGEDVDDDQVSINGEVLIFISEDGETIHEIKIPNMDNHGEHSKRVWMTSGGGEFGHQGGEFTIDIIGNDGELDDEHIAWMIDQAQPKVMLGINLGEPSKILRKHLNIKGNAILVEKIIEGLPAALSGVQDFDIIISIDGSDDASGELLGKILAEKDAGDIMKLVVIRNGDQKKIKVKLAAYDAKALGNDKEKDVRLFPQNINAPRLPGAPGTPKMIELKILDELENGKFGHIQGLEIEKLRESLHRQLEEAGIQGEMIIDVQGKAMDAMRHAERQMVEFRDGKLFVGSREKLDGSLLHLQHELHEQMGGFNMEALHEQLSELDERLEEIEEVLEEELEEMSETIEDLMEMFEDLMEALEDDD